MRGRSPYKTTSYFFGRGLLKNTHIPVQPVFLEYVIKADIVKLYVALVGGKEGKSAPFF